MMDHPTNPRYPVTWFTRANLLGAGLLMPGDLTVERGATLDLTYGFAVLSCPVAPGQVEALYQAFASEG